MMRAANAGTAVTLTDFKVAIDSGIGAAAKTEAKMSRLENEVVVELPVSMLSMTNELKAMSDT